MTIATSGERASLAAKYGTDCPYLALTNGAPGTGTLANELTSAGYARMACSWSGSGGYVTATGSATIAADQPVTHAVLVADASGATAVLDSVAVSWTTNAAEAIANVTATFTIT